MRTATVAAILAACGGRRAPSAPPRVEAPAIAKAAPPDAGLSDAPTAPATPATAFATAAAAGSTFYWRTPDGACDAWKVSGDLGGGTLRRIAPAPSLVMTFALDGDALVLRGAHGSSPRFSERPEALCDDRLALGADDHAGFAIGDGVWYWTEQACTAAGATHAATSCTASLSQVYRSAPAIADDLTAAIGHGGTVEMLVVGAHGLGCASWRFRGKGDKLRMEQRDGGDVTSYDVRYADDKLELAGPNVVTRGGGTLGIGDFETYDVVHLAPGVILVGDEPWFAGKGACAKILAATAAAGARSSPP